MLAQLWRGLRRLERRLGEMKPGTVVGSNAGFLVVEVDEVAPLAQVTVGEHVGRSQDQSRRDAGCLERLQCRAARLLGRPRSQERLQAVLIGLTCLPGRETSIPRPFGMAAHAGQGLPL